MGNGNVSATVTLTGTGYHVLDHFTVVVAPSTVTLGEPTTLTITAINNDGTVDDTYTGTINLSCTDPACKLPVTNHTFTADDKGVHVFPAGGANPLNFNTLGVWTVTVTDTTFTSGKTYTGTSNPVTVVTTPLVSLSSSVNPVILGANTTLTATVSSPCGTPTGTVTFMDGSTVLGTVALNSSGVATLAVSFSTAGSHPITVSYPGAGYFQAANFFAGPRYTYNVGHISPTAWNRKGSIFVQGKVGYAFATAGQYPIKGVLTSNASSLDLESGGGVNLHIYHRFDLRLVEMDLVHTRLPDGADNVQNSLRFGTGINFHIGC